MTHMAMRRTDRSTASIDLNGLCSSINKNNQIRPDPACGYNVLKPHAIFQHFPHATRIADTSISVIDSIAPFKFDLHRLAQLITAPPRPAITVHLEPP